MLLFLSPVLSVFVTLDRPLVIKKYTLRVSNPGCIKRRIANKNITNILGIRAQTQMQDTGKEGGMTILMVVLRDRQSSSLR